MKFCATCSSFSNFVFSMSEDIKGILKSLLYDFDIDGFFQLKPPDKQLMLCDKCNHRLRDMILFKERAQKSFIEFKKFWLADMQKRIMRKTVSVSSSLQISATPLQIIRIDPEELKCEESDPLDINTETECIVDTSYEHNESLIEIKEEDKTDTFYQPEPVEGVKYELKVVVNNNAKMAKNDNFNQDFVNNKVAKPTNRQFNINAAPFGKNAAKCSTNFVNMEVPAMRVINSFNINSVNTNTAVPSNDKLNEKFVPKMRVCNNGPNLTNNLNVIMTDNSCINSVAENPDDIEDTIESSILFKKNINTDASNMTYATNITNSRNLNKIVFQNNECVFKCVNIDDNEQFVVNSESDKLKIVKIDHIGNVENMGEGMVFNPVIVTEEGKLVVQKPTIAITTFESPAKSTVNYEIEHEQNAIDHIIYNIISTSDTGQGEEHISDSDEDNMKKDKVDSAVKAAKVKSGSKDYPQRKWYINIVTREEILKNMAESRNSSDFLKAPFKCEHCVSILPNERVVETHKMACHKKDSDFTCFACLCTFEDLTDLKSHYYIHTIDSHVYYCTTCEFETREVMYMRDHVCPNAGSKHLPPKDPNTMRLSRCGSLYYCPKCEHINTCGRALTLHYTNRHKNNPKVKCDECGNLYKSEKGFRYHVDTVHRGKKQKEPHETQIYCKPCNKWLLNKNSYSAHMKNVHTQKEPKFQCDECGKKLLTAKKLESHKDFHVIMKGGKNHKCDVCGKAYYTERMLRKHRRSTHENKPTIRNHVCEVCGMAFFNKIILKHHMAKHSNERPYKCSFCDDTFKYPAALHTHTKLKHKKKAEESLVNNVGQEKREKYGEKRKTVKRRRIESESVESASTEESRFAEATLLNF